MVKSTQTIEEAISTLLAGGVGVLPTDTVYGLVARVADQAAMARLAKLKNRERKPIPVMAASVAQLRELGVPAACLEKVAHLWPNPLSIVLPVDAAHAYLHQGLGDLPFRIVADDALRKILARTGPLAATSANRPGEPTAATIAEAQAYFGNKVDFYVDGGELSGRLSSTIIKLTDAGFVMVRPGAVELADLLSRNV